MAQEIAGLEQAVRELTQQLRGQGTPGMPSPAMSGGGAPFGSGMSDLIQAAGSAGGGLGLLEVLGAGAGGGLLARTGAGGALSRVLPGLGKLLTTTAGQTVTATLAIGDLVRDVEALGITLQNTLDPLGQMVVDLPGLQREIANLTSVWAYGERYAQAFVGNMFELAKLRTGDTQIALRETAKNLTLLQQSFDPSAPQKVSTAVIELGYSAAGATDMLWELVTIADYSGLPFDVYSRAVLNVVSNLKAWGLTVEDVRENLAELMKIAQESGKPLDLVARDYGGMMRAFETAGPDPTLIFTGMMLQQAEKIPAALRASLDEATGIAREKGLISAEGWGEVRPQEMQWVLRELSTRGRLEFLTAGLGSMKERFGGRGQDPAVLNRIIENWGRSFGFQQIEDLQRFTELTNEYLKTGSKLTLDELEELVGSVKDARDLQVQATYSVADRILDVHNTVIEWYKTFSTHISRSEKDASVQRLYQRSSLQEQMRVQGASKELATQWAKVQLEEAGPGKIPTAMQQEYVRTAVGAIMGADPAEMRAAFAGLGIVGRPGGLGGGGAAVREAQTRYAGFQVRGLEARLAELAPTGPEVMGGPAWLRRERGTMALGVTRELLQRTPSAAGKVDFYLNLAMEAAKGVDLVAGMTQDEFKRQVLNAVSDELPFIYDQLSGAERKE